MPAMTGKTLYDKIWDAHVVADDPNGETILYIDLHLIHEVTTPQAFAGLRAAGRGVRRPDLTLAVADHNVPTEGQAKGVDAVIPFRTMLADLVAHTEVNRNYQKSDLLQTIRILKKFEIEVCCGGIFGLGETERDRIEFAFILKALDVDCLPINFLNPVPGTRFANNPALEPWQLLKMVAIYRFILPNKEIRICGGRQSNLG